MRTLIRTDALPPGDRFPCFRDQLLRLPVPLDASFDRPEDFGALLCEARLGALTVVSLRTRTRGPYEVARTPALIRRSDPGAYRLVLNVRGRGGVTQCGRDAVLGPGDLALYDTSRPFTGWRGSAGTVNEWAMVTFPHALLPLPAPVIAPLLGARLAGDAGVGALMSGFLARLAADVGAYAPQDAVGLAGTLMDLLSVLLAHETGAMAPEQDRRSLLLRVQAFIEDRLGDPALAPAMIAAAHNISTRQLHRLFRTHGLTVAGWTRDRRLERCRRDLADPLLRSRPVYAIGARWGFADAAHFSRVFRAASGISPQAYRDQRRESAPGAGTGAHGQRPGAG